MTDEQTSEAGMTLPHLVWNSEVMYAKILGKYAAFLRVRFW